MILVVSITIIYGQDLGTIFQKAFNFSSGNIGNYIIAIPFLLAYVVYRKRGELHLAVSAGIQKHRYLDELVGIATCCVAIGIFFFGSTTFYALEYHIFSLIIFGAGATVVLFNITTFKKIFFAFVLASFLIPIPIEFTNALISGLNPITAILVKESLTIFGNHVTFDSAGNMPALLVQMQDGSAQLFQIGEPSSGIYSMVILSSVGLFIAYITSGKIWKRMSIWAIGFPVIFLLNAFRIFMLVSLWYNFGHDVAESYHAISGSLTIALGAFLLLFLGDKIFHIKIQHGEKTKNKYIVASIPKTTSLHHTACSKKQNVLKISTLVIITLAVLSQVSTNTTQIYATNQVSDQTNLEIGLIDSNDVKSLLPTLDGWDLQYAYRDWSLEKTLRHDLFVALKYVEKDTAEYEIFTAIDIGNYIHRLESSLTLPGRQSATILVQEDIKISDDKGRFLAYKTPDSDRIIVVLYWNQEVFLDSLEKKYVQLTVTSNTDYLVYHNLIHDKTDYEEIKKMFLSLAVPMDDYWKHDITLGKTPDGKLVLVSSSASKLEYKPVLNANTVSYDNLNLQELIEKADKFRLVDYNFVDSLEIYKIALEKDPDNIDALNGIGDSLVKLNGNESAPTYYDRVLQKDQDNTRALNGMGTVSYNLGKLDDVKLFYNKVLALDSRNTDAMIGLGAISLDLGNYDEAIQWSNKVLVIDKENPSAIALQVNAQIKIITPIDLTQKISGLSYSAYRSDQSPDYGPYPTIQQIEDDIKFLSSITERIRIYGVHGIQESIPPIAQKYGLKVDLSLLLTDDATQNSSEIDQATNLANRYPEIINSIIVSSEALHKSKVYKSTLTEEQLIDIILETKSKLNSETKVTIAEPVHIWLDHPKLAAYVDYITIHHYSYWAGIDIEEAAVTAVTAYDLVKNAFKKDVVIGETGWPSDGLTIKHAVPSPENQERFIKDFRSIANSKNIQYYLFEAFDESWKKDELLDSDIKDNTAENHWGLFYENGTMKDSLKKVLPHPVYDSSRT